MGVFHKLYEDKLKQVYKDAIVEDSATRGSLFMSYYTATISTFKWTNLPEGTLPFQPEEYLTYWARMAFFKDDDGSFKMFPAYPSGSLLENGEYDRYTIISKNGKVWERSRDDIALCYDNSMMIPFIVIVEELSGKSSVALEAVDSALRKAILPAVISCKDEQQMNMLADMYDKVKRLLPFRLTMNGGFSDDSINTFNIFDNAKNDVISLWDVYVRYRNLFYTTIGVNNIEIQKRERLTKSEGSGNDEITRYTFLNDRYLHRLTFKDEVKEKFNYELGLEINRDTATVYEENLTNEEKIANAELDMLKGINTNLGGKEDNNNEPTEDTNAQSV